MKEDNVERKIADAMNRAVPDCLDEILSRCEEEGKVIKMEERKQKFTLRKLGAAAAAIMVIVGAVSFMNMSGSDSTVFLDVNPSVELVVGKNERIKEAAALNSDAAKILYGMDLKNTDLDVGVNAIIGSMVKNGYLSELNNSILVSVENNDEKKNAELKEKISGKIDEVLAGFDVNGAVLSQTVDKKENPKVKEMSEKYGISKGKSELIMSIMDKDAGLKEENLAGLTINELNLIMDSKNISADKVESKGTPSEKKYIGKEKAKQIALRELGLSDEFSNKLEVSMDSENNELCYEIEIEIENQKYELNINAQDGRITAREVKNISSPKAPLDSKKLSKEEAEKIIFKELGISKEKAGSINIEEDEEEGRAVYEAEFTFGDNKYSIVIDACSGEILEREKKENKLSIVEEGKPVFGKITPDEALNTALKKAGIKRSEAEDIDCELDRNGEKLVVEVEFKAGGKEYSFEIDAETGEILESEEENDSKNAENKKFKISKEKAESIALKAGGVNKQEAEDLNTEEDIDGGNPQYEVKFKSGSREYEIKIDGITGEIIKKEIEDEESEEAEESEEDDEEDEEDDDDDDSSEDKKED